MGLETAFLVILVSQLAGAEGDLPFARCLIDATGPPEPWFKMLGDLDGDGKLDVVIGGRQGPVVAYLFPRWKRVKLADSGPSGVDGEAGDMDGDGDTDLVLGGLVWLENPLRGAGPWRSHPIARLRAHDVELGDLDGDGRLDVAARDQSGFGSRAGDRLHLFRRDAQGAWSARDLECPHGEGLCLGDLDKDGDPDLVIGGRWYENPGSWQGEWRERLYAAGWAHLDVKVEVGDVDGDGRPDAILAPAEPAGGSYRLSWFRAPEDPRGGDWEERRILEPVETVIHGLAAGDLDLDGDLDLVTAEMHQGQDPDEVAVHLNLGRGQSWRRQILSTRGSHNIKLADLEADGDLDILGANWSGPYQAIEVWINGARKPSGTAAARCR